MGLFDLFSNKSAEEAARKANAGLQAGYTQLSDLYGQGRNAITSGYGKAEGVLSDVLGAYKPGAAALYGTLGCACLPFALNSGLFWPRRKFMRLPGTVILEFLPLIPAGLPRKAFQERLQNDIETTTARLVAEGREAVRIKNKFSTPA